MYIYIYENESIENEHWSRSEEKEVPTSLSSGRILNPVISKPRGRMETGWLRSKPIATYHPHFNSR